MRKLLILVVVAVLLFSGCVDKKAIETSAEQPNVSPNAALAQENDIQKPDEPNQTDVAQPAAESDENSSKAATKETLQELEGLLEELQQGDFADIDFSE